MLAVSLLLLNISTAWAELPRLRPDNFFDFEFAKTVWLQWPDEQFSRELGKCPDGGVFEQWRARKRSNPAAAMTELETHPQADLIRRCWDVALTYERVWLPMYFYYWRSFSSVNGPRRWGECADGFTNLLMRDSNIFTHRCDDMPDWRTPADVARDERLIESGNETRRFRKRLQEKREADRAKRNAG